MKFDRQIVHEKVWRLCISFA